MADVTKVVVRMYKLGTGDCFVLKFFAGETETYKVLIDCGYWTGTAAKIRPIIKEIKEYVDDHLHLLVVTHEHMDHVRGFHAAKQLFTTNFTVDRIWMAWSEEDGDPTVEEWKADLGQKKIALTRASNTLNSLINNGSFDRQLADTRHHDRLLSMRQRFAGELKSFADLHVDETLDSYKGALKGMAVVKDDIAQNNIDYLNAGDIIEDVPGMDGMRVFVLGPPNDPRLIKKEHGHGDEAFPHNVDLSDTDLFAHAVHQLGKRAHDKDPDLLPFDDGYVSQDKDIAKLYKDKKNGWRNIDHDWLFNAGYFALRLNSGINNLSLVLAFEFKDSGRVLLFPGDAEYGSWKSWHEWVWGERDGKEVTTEDLLNRVVFYKVAHHLSHNGTARSIGLDMMTHPDLAAMAPLDYDVISGGWKSTMPNRLILKNLLKQTKGRTFVMNPDGIFYDLNDRVPLAKAIKDERNKMTASERSAFEAAHSEGDHFIEYVVQGS